MPKKPGPWRRKQDGWYYATLDGKKVRLSKDHKEAMRLYHKEQARRAEVRRGPSSPVEAPTVAELLDAFLVHVEANQSRATLELRLAHLKSFNKRYGEMSSDAVRPYHATAWLDRPSWGPSMRAMALASLKRAYNWGVDEGLIEVNPIARAKGGAGRRRGAPDPEAARAVIAAAPRALAEFLEGLRETGCRPGELASADVGDLDAENGTLAVRGKTGERLIYLSPKGLALAKELAARHPEGPLFRSEKGRRWCRNLWKWWIRRVATEAGVEVTAYSFRHLWASEAIARGVDSLLVAELMGHRDTKMLAKFYHHARGETLREAARKARGDSG